MKASYYDPVNDTVVEILQCSENDTRGLISAILTLRSQRGHPTLELQRGDGASLSFSTDGERVYLVWINPLGESFHSVGGSPREGVALVFDYFGTWSEAPPQYLVRFDDAIQCVRSFWLTGAPDTDHVLFEPD